MSTIPSYALYGEHSAPYDNWMHWETITSRSRLYGFHIAPHRHDQLAQILFVRSGLAEVTLDDTVRQVSGPSIVVVPPLVVHTFTFASDIDGFVLTFFARDLLELVKDVPEVVELLGNADIIGPSNDNKAMRAVEQAVIDLTVEVGRTAPGQGLATRARVMLVLAAIHNLAVLTSGDTGAQSRRSEVLARAYRAEVDQNYRKTRSIVQYAQNLGISATHLNRVCNQVFGTSALMVIERRIVLEARRYLQFSVLNVKEIGIALGYDDPAYFSRFFKRQTGLTPQQFREQSRVTA